MKTAEVTEGSKSLSFKQIQNTKKPATITEASEFLHIIQAEKRGWQSENFEVDLYISDTLATINISMRTLIIATICFVSSVTMTIGQDSADTIRYEAYPEAAQHEIATIIESFDEVENPFIATYLGSEFHDHFYFPFRGANGVYYDFGYRNNNLGEIPFGEFDAPYPELDAPENTSPGARLVGGKFLIYWEYELSYVICCEGGQNSYPAWLPRISKIEHYKD